MTSGDWDGVRLHVVTGKGGTGKTTVAAALALALADSGKRVLLAEVEGRQGISQVFDVAPLADLEVRIARTSSGGEVHGLSVDAKAALLEYLQLFYKLGRAGGVLERFGAIDFATTIAPGVRDVLLIGKIYEAVRRREPPSRARAKSAHGTKTNRSGTSGKPGSPHARVHVYDAIVLDAPPTGRVARFLNVNHEVAGLARVGPIRSQADSITALLQSPQSAVHIVSLLEEMPVQESLDAAAELAASGFGRGSMIINQVHVPELDESDLDAARAGTLRRDQLGSDLASAGIKASATLVSGLLAETTDLAERVALEHQEAQRLDQTGRPSYRLPLLPEGVDTNGIRELAGALLDQGMP